MSSPLVEIAKQKKQEWINCRQNSRLERENWKNKVKELYAQIKQWLMPLEQDNLLRWQEENKQNTTEGIEVGDYLTVIFFNGQTIQFDPVGLEVVGAYGRVDMRLGLHKVMIVMPKKNGNWLFAERYNREEPTLYDFNQENFEQLVTEFIESFS